MDFMLALFVLCMIVWCLNLIVAVNVCVAYFALYRFVNNHQHIINLSVEESID